MLLDDVMSELDADRRRLLAEELSAAGQSVIATTDLAHVPGGADRSVTSCGSRAAPFCRRPSRREPPGSTRDLRGARRAHLGARAGEHAGPRPGGLGARCRPAIAAASRPVAERAGVLTVACEAAVWAQELELMGEELVVRLNRELGEESISSLRCRTE